MKAGDKVIISDVLGDEHGAVAASGVEGTHAGSRKIHDFPVVWVRLHEGSLPLPWPADAVRPEGSVQEGEAP